MKKYLCLMFLLLVTIETSAQKMTIKTANGQTVEILCEGIAPTEIVVVRDSVIFKVQQTAQEELADSTMNTSTAEADTIDIIDASISFDDEIAQEIDTLEVDTLNQNFVASSKSSVWGGMAQSLAREFAPGYAQLEDEHKDDEVTEKDLVKEFSEGFVDKDVVEAVDLIGTILGGISFTKDTTFVAKYEQRKPKKKWRAYNIIDFEGSFGKNINGVSDAVADRVSFEDYGDDTKNEHKFGGGIKGSRVYISGKEVGDVWKPNALGLAWSWGGLLAYSYEQEMGSYVSAMGKIGAQIGSDITIGVDGLLGCGVTPYNTFYTNGMNHSTLNRSAFCFKYGVQLWGSLNFSNNVYTAFYGRYVRSIKPSTAFENLPKGWRLVVEDFDPSSWTIGLSVGYKFGAPATLSPDKRLQANVSTGYQVLGHQKGTLVSAELARFTQITSRAYINYGFAVEKLYDSDRERGNYPSVLCALGLKVDSQFSKWFWESKLYGGMGNYAVTFNAEEYGSKLSQSSQKLCVKTALQLGGGLKLGKCSEIYGACRAGYHFGKTIEVEGVDGISYVNLRGFDMDFRLGYRYTF